MATSPAELRSRLVGVHTTMVSPFDRDGNLDLATLGRLVDYIIEGGVGAISYPLTVGEAGSLTLDETCRGIETVVERARGRVPVLAGAIRASTQECVQVAKRAAAAGADGIVGMAPYFFKIKQEEIFLHFSILADSTPLGIVVYDHPAVTKVEISQGTMDRLGTLPTVVAVLPTTTDMAVVLSQKERLPESIQMMGGREEYLAIIGLLGLRNITSGTANFAPRFFKKLWESARDGDMATFLPAFQTLRELRVLMQPGLGGGHFGTLASYAKAALRLLDIPCGDVRPPLVPLTASDTKGMAEMLRKMGLDV